VDAQLICVVDDEVSIIIEKGFVRIPIMDIGFGILKEDIEKIFNRFCQVDKSRYRGNDKGDGLGLSIAS